MDNSTTYQNTTNGETDNTLKLVITSIISTLMITMNIAVFAVVPKVKSLFESALGVAMLNLALTDVMLGISGLVNPIGLSFYSVADNGSLFCTFTGIGNPTLASVSILTLTFITVDKYLTLKYPLHYKLQMSPKRAFIIIILIWLVVAVLYFVVLIPGVPIGYRLYKGTLFCIINFNSNIVYTSIIIFLVQFLPTVICVTAFTGIYRIIRHHKSEMLNLQVS